MEILLLRYWLLTQELAGAMKLLGLQPTQEEITHIINEYDLDGDGHIDFS